MLLDLTLALKTLAAGALERVDLITEQERIVDLI